MKHSIDSLKELGRYGDALAMAQDLLSRSPDNASLLYKIASLYDVQGLELQAVPFIAPLSNITWWVQNCRLLIWG